MRYSTLIFALLAATAAPPLLAQQPGDAQRTEHRGEHRGDHRGDDARRQAPPAAARPAPTPAPAPAPQPNARPRQEQQGQPGRWQPQARPNPPAYQNNDRRGYNQTYPGARPDHRNPDANRRPDMNRRPDGNWRNDHNRPDNRRYEANRNPRGQWNQNWRNDRRYDWRSYRSTDRARFRMPRYYAPRGYSYRRWAPGYRLDPFFYARSYWLLTPEAYRLPPAYGPYRWVRYYDDVLLVDIETGMIVDVIPNFFWS